MRNIEEFAKKRIELYGCDFVIEGHYHQGYQDENYLNIPSLACDRIFTIYKNNEFKFIQL